MCLVVAALIAASLPFFFKARSKAQHKRCLDIMQWIDGGKFSFAMAQNKSTGYVLTPEDLELLGQYLPGEGWNMTKCPAKGEYDIAPIAESPSCSIHGKLPKNMMR